MVCSVSLRRKVAGVGCAILFLCPVFMLRVAWMLIAKACCCSPTTVDYRRKLPSHVTNCKKPIGRRWKVCLMRWRYSVCKTVCACANLRHKPPRCAGSMRRPTCGRAIRRFVIARQFRPAGWKSLSAKGKIARCGACARRWATRFCVCCAPPSGRPAWLVWHQANGVKKQAVLNFYEERKHETVFFGSHDALFERRSRSAAQFGAD